MATPAALQLQLGAADGGQQEGVAGTVHDCISVGQIVRPQLPQNDLRYSLESPFSPKGLQPFFHKFRCHIVRKKKESEGRKLTVDGLPVHFSSLLCL